MLLALVMSVSACQDEPDDKLATVHYERAESYLEDGQYRAAVLEASNVIRKTPEKASGYVLLAKIHNRVGDFASALNVLEAAPEAVASDPSLLLESLESYVGVGKVKSAISTLKKLNTQSLSSSDSIEGEKKLDEVELALHNAMLLRVQGDGEGAAKMYAELLESQPSRVDVLLAAAELDLLMGEKELAEEKLLSASGLSSADSRLLFLQGILNLQREQLAVAELRLNEALDIRSVDDIYTKERVAILVQLEQLMNMQGRSVEAMAYRENLLKGADIVAKRVDEALRLFQTGELDEALVVVDGILADQPTHTTANLVKASIFARTARYEESADIYAEYIDFELNSPELVEASVQAHLRAGRFEQLLSRLEEYRGLNEDARMLNVYGRALAENDQQEQAIAALQKSIAVDATYIPSYLLLDLLYQQAQKEPEASVALLGAGLQALESLEQTNPKTGQTYLSLGKAYIAAFYRAEQFAEAKEFVLRELQSSDTSAEALHLAAAHALLKQDYEKARTYAIASLEKDPSDAGLWTALAAIERQLGKPFNDVLEAASKAVEVDSAQVLPYRQLLALAENADEEKRVVEKIESISERYEQAAGLQVLSRYYLDKDDIERALAYLNRFRDARQDPDAGQLLEQRIGLRQAELFAIQGDPDAARQLLLAALEKNPRSPTLLSSMVRLELSESNFASAHQYAEQLSALEPAVGAAHDAEVFKAEAKFDEAIARYQEAWAYSPDSGIAARLYDLLTRHVPEEAAAFLQEWEEVEPNSAERWQVLSSKALAEGDVDAAVPMIESLLEIEPNNAMALNNLAWLYQNRGDGRSIALAERAYELAPQTAQVIDTYAWVLAENGQVTKAISLFEDALQLEPGNVDIQKNLEAAKAKL